MRLVKVFGITKDSFFNLKKFLRKSPKVNLFVLEYKEKHIAVDFVNKKLLYNYVTSPTYATEDFPEGYFDKHSTDLDKKELSKIRKQLKNCIRKFRWRECWNLYFMSEEA